MTPKRRPARKTNRTRPAKKSAEPRPRKPAAAKGPSREPAGDPLDDLIEAGARSLDLAIDAAWLPAVREHLRVVLLFGARVSQFQLPDDAEPAPLYRA